MSPAERLRHPAGRIALKTAAAAAVAAAAVWLARSGRAAAAGHWVRLGAVEYQFRRVIGVPLRYPERVYGGDEAAEKGDFPAWSAELAGDGLEASQIIDAVRREEGQ